uniref:PseudoU_synth_2 domain-containing protein n=1 Tax=Heterorhabditis bacteriophora TaxID=37862 RepID=A0A1I7XTE4_HETBA
MGRIYVNGNQMTDVEYVMKNGDRIEHWGHKHEHPVRDLPIPIVADTDDLLVVNKPPSLPVHACGQYAVHTVLGQLRTRYNRNGLRGPNILHRLDRATSGILMLAKNYETDFEFKETLKKGEWTKEYVCMVDGVFPEFYFNKLIKDNFLKDVFLVFQITAEPVGLDRENRPSYDSICLNCNVVKKNVCII